MRLPLEGAENLPSGPAVIAASHRTWIDPLILLRGEQRAAVVIVRASRPQGGATSGILPAMTVGVRESL